MEFGFPGSGIDRESVGLKHLEGGRLCLHAVQALGEVVSECYCLQNQKLGRRYHQVID